MGSCASSPCQRDGLCVPYLNGTNGIKNNPKKKYLVYDNKIKLRF